MKWTPAEKEEAASVQDPRLAVGDWRAGVVAQREIIFLAGAPPPGTAPKTSFAQHFPSSLQLQRLESTTAICA